MVIVLSPTATEITINDVVSRVADVGGQAFVSRGERRTIIGLVGDLGFGLLTLSRLKSQQPPTPPTLPNLGCVRFAPRGSLFHG